MHWRSAMTEDEVDWVAAEMAKAGGVSWYPGRERGPLKVVSDRYRDRARLAIAALERYRASKQDASPPAEIEAELHEPDANASQSFVSDHAIVAGSKVLYRPTGDRRAYLCWVEKIEGRRAYLVPDMKTCTGWVDLERLSPAGEPDISDPLRVVEREQTCCEQ
jgi:hypothetical protein